MVILKFEIIKLLKQRVFVVLAAVSLLGCVLTCFAAERRTPEYFYVYSHRENYQRFMDGDTDADINGFYTAEAEAQSKYIESYVVFVGEMTDRIERMSGTSIYSDKISFLNRNLIKTQEDFASFAGTMVQAGNNFGIRGYADFNGGLLFTLVFLAVLTYFMLFYERGMNLLLLLKGCKNGHIPLAAAKFTAMLLVSAFYTIAQELGILGVFGMLYGLGDLRRPIQSISYFRNCAHHLTVGGAIAATVAIRVGVSALLVSVLFLIGMTLRSEAAAVLASGGILGIESFFSNAIASGGTLNWLKFINLVYCWGMRNTLGEYRNLDLFGYPLGKGVAALTAGIVLAVSGILAGVVIFGRSCQIRSAGIFERIKLWLRTKTDPLWRSSSLVWFEFYKLLIGQKKVILLLLLVLWGVYEVRNVNASVYFLTSEALSYHYYMNEIQGPVTQETADYLAGERERLDGLRHELSELGDTTDDYDQLMVRSMLIQSELELYEEGLDAVIAQFEWLKCLPGGLSNKYMVDEQSIEKLWGDVFADVRLWLIGSAFTFLFISGIRTNDESRSMMPLLHSTENGRRKLDGARRRTAFILTLLTFIATEMPLFLRYHQTGVIQCLSHRLDWFSNGDYTSSCTVGLLLVIIFVLKALSFLAVCLTGELLVRYTRNETVTTLAGIGVISAVATLLFGVKTDITTIVLRIMG